MRKRQHDSEDDEFINMTLMLGNLQQPPNGWQWLESQLHLALTKYGIIKHTKIFIHRGIYFVRYRSREEAELALHSIQAEVKLIHIFFITLSSLSPRVIHYSHLIACHNVVLVSLHLVYLSNGCWSGGLRPVRKCSNTLRVSL